MSSIEGHAQIGYASHTKKTHLIKIYHYNRKKMLKMENNNNQHENRDL